MKILNMKQILFAIAILLLSVLRGRSQDLVKQASTGFDSLRVDIAHGKIDTISYTSKTVGATRRSLIYTPPGFS